MSSDLDRLIHLAAIFAMLSMLAVGGGTAVLPEMKHVTVLEQSWLTAREFNDYYAVGQFVPGPNMLMVSLIGLHAAGWLGAGVVVVAFFLPFSTLMFFASRAWDRFSESPWRVAIEKGLAPVTIGLMFSGVYAVGHAAIVGLAPALIGAGVALAILFTKIKAPYLMALGALLGFLFLG